jgi:transaldolase
MLNINKTKIKIYADGADIKDFKALMKLKYIHGYTTNPSLMRKAGVKNYKFFAKKVINIVKNKPISFEILGDTTEETERQAKEISSWGKSVYVKIPIMNTKKILNTELIGKLNRKGIKINVTAIFTTNQTKQILKYLGKKTQIVLSVFCGRIADTGVDPVIEIKKHLKLGKKFKNVKFLWASVREPFNIVQAENSRCHIITVPPEILTKTKNFNKNLNSFSQETVQMFFDDAEKSKYKI